MTANKERDEMDRTSTDRRSPSVRQVYRFGNARWYDAFRTIWTWATSRTAEAKLDQCLREAASDGCRVLDIGCGTGFNVGRLQRLGIPFGSYLGVDLTDAMLTIAREHYAGEPRASFLEADLATLPGTSERFDVVLCTWVASHLDHPREAFEIGFEVLAPSGQAFFLTMTQPKWYVSWWFAPFAYLFQARFVDPDSLADLPGLKRLETGAAGLVTSVCLQKEGAHDPVTPDADSPRTGGQT